MISRRTARIVGQNYGSDFCYKTVSHEELYDFLFDHDYSPWFCNGAKRMQYSQCRVLKDYIMQLHTGETQVAATKEWTWEQRHQLGQTYLEKLACDILNKPVTYDPHGSREKNRHELQSNLELDGYEYRNGRLIASEIDVHDTQEAVGVLGELYVDLRLNNVETALHCLKLSDEHWLNQNWDDCISNARRFLELTMQEVAVAHSRVVKNSEMNERVYSRPVRVREYLENEGLLERQEMAALKETYGFLSHTGSHPYIAAKDQARLLRQLALLYSQFVLLRFKGTIVNASSGV
ncbi:MAG: hypothetical protein IH991_04830 [Planctomycetes bacterium]|nr:hypothetical protein [Planctomycetota bacterium]